MSTALGGNLIRSRAHEAIEQPSQVLVQVCLVVLVGDAVHSGRGIPPQFPEALVEHLQVDQPVQVPEAVLRFLRGFPVQCSQGA